MKWFKFWHISYLSLLKCTTNNSSVWQCWQQSLPAEGSSTLCRDPSGWAASARSSPGSSVHGQEMATGPAGKGFIPQCFRAFGAADNPNTDAGAKTDSRSPISCSTKCIPTISKLRFFAAEEWKAICPDREQEDLQIPGAEHMQINPPVNPGN